MCQTKAAPAAKDFRRAADRTRGGFLQTHKPFLRRSNDSTVNGNAPANDAAAVRSAWSSREGARRLAPGGSSPFDANSQLTDVIEPLGLGPVTINYTDHYLGAAPQGAAEAPPTHTSSDLRAPGQPPWGSFYERAHHVWRLSSLLPLEIVLNRGRPCSASQIETLDAVFGGLQQTDRR
jgi:hypothetical protein